MFLISHMFLNCGCVVQFVKIKKLLSLVVNLTELYEK